MKAENSNINRAQNVPSISFKGYVGEKKENGNEFLKFFPPLYRKNAGDKIYLELCALKRGKGIDVAKEKEATAWVIDKSVEPIIVEESGDLFANNSPVSINRSADFLKNVIFRSDDNALGYRFVVKDKNGNIKERLTDFSGVKTQGDNRNVYGVITKNQSVPVMSGPIYHMFFNSFAPETTQKEDMPNRNHFNEADTTLKSVISEINKGTLDPFKLILSTPIFGKDEVSSNGYWTTNPYQISSKIGTTEDFADLQTTLFDKGKAWIADGAFTSQGYQSPLVANVLKHGDESPFKHWLKIDGKPTLGVLPDRGQTDDDTFKHIMYKVVNSPLDKKTYAPYKPTYIQFYDDRLVSEEQKNSNKLIDRYAKQVPDIGNTGLKDPYAIGTHQDSVQHYAFEINPADSQKMKQLREYEGKSLDDINTIPLDNLFDFGNFKIGEKNSASGANFWEGQVDLIKMNLSGVDNNDEDRAGMVQARNYLYGCATYWTKTTNNALVGHIADLLSKDKDNEVKKIQNAFDIDDKSISEIKKNIDENNYNFNILNSGLGINPADKKNDFILNEIVNFPLESIEFSSDITGIIASPYVSARPTMLKYQNAPKLDIVRGTYKGKDESIYSEYAKTNSKMNDLYMGKIYDFVKGVLENMKTPEPIFKDDTSELTDYGKFIVRQTAPDIVKYAVVTSLFGDNDVKLNAEKGKIEYNFGTLREESLASLNQDNPESEAKSLISEIDKGFSINSLEAKKADLAEVLSKKFENVKLNDFKLAQALVDKTGAGLNWRFDAAKDIADSNLLYNKSDTYEHVFEESVDFWKNFVSNIKNENSSSYTIGEVTDLYFFFEGKYSGVNNIAEKVRKNAGRFSEDRTAQRIFVEDTGMTSLTNYAYMYSAIPGLLSIKSEDGKTDWYGNIGGVPGKDNYKYSFAQSLDFFLASGPLSMINYSHVATGNHDKPRVMHAMAVDMNIFLFDSIDKFDDEEKKKTAIKNFKDTIAYVMDTKPDNIDYNKYSSYAIAVAAKLKGTLWADGKFQYNEKYEKVLNEAIKDIAQGKYIGQKEPNLRRAAAFGNDDIRASLNNILDYAIYSADDTKDFVNANEKTEKEALINDKNKILNETMIKILDKPMKEQIRMWQLMNAISGNPTLYGGDEYAQTGYETPSKNVYVKNRGIIDHKIIKEPKNKAIAEYNKHIKAIAQIHKIKGLSALSGGTLTQLFGAWCGKDWPDGMRSRCFVNNDDKGSVTFTVITPVHDEKMIKNRNADNLSSEPKESPMIELFTLNDNYKVSSAITPGMKLGRVVYNKEKGTYEPDGKTYALTEHNSKYYIEDTSGKPIKITGLATYFYKI